MEKNQKTVKTDFFFYKTVKKKKKKRVNHIIEG